jgi:hypothetical protein
MWLPGCTGLKDKLASFQPGDAGSHPISLPDVCEAFLIPVNVPTWITSETDAIVAFGPVADSLLEANDRILDARSCFADQRKAYAGPAKPAPAVKVAAKVEVAAKAKRGAKAKKGKKP